jgi:Protein of unknown function (DUF2423)
MAKSTRSKVKRAFRAKKRTEGVFAAADAARLQRLNAKLHAQSATATATGGGQGGGDSDHEEEQDVDMPGSSWFAAFGLLDHQDINSVLMQCLDFSSSAYPLHPMSPFTRPPSPPI